MKRIALLAVSAALATWGPAFAASTASASVGPISIQLFDLNPLDGIAPSITFASDGNFDSKARAAAGQSVPSTTIDNALYGKQAWADVMTTAVVSLASASASVSGAAAPGGNGAVVSSTGSAADFSAGAFDISSFYATASGPSVALTGAFVLSANTVAVISGTGSFSAAASSTNTNSFGSYAQVNIDLKVTGPAAGGGGGIQSASDSMFSMVYAYDLNPVASTSDSRTLAVSFVNLTGADMTGNLQLTTVVEGLNHAFTAPVPEPASCALLLAGMAVVGLRRTRLARRGFEPAPDTAT